MYERRISGARGLAAIFDILNHTLLQRACIAYILVATLKGSSYLISLESEISWLLAKAIDIERAVYC